MRGLAVLAMTLVFGCARAPAPGPEPPAWALREGWVERAGDALSAFGVGTGGTGRFADALAGNRARANLHKLLAPIPHRMFFMAGPGCCGMPAPEEDLAAWERFERRVVDHWMAAVSSPVEARRESLPTLGRVVVVRFELAEFHRRLAEDPELSEKQREEVSRRAAAALADLAAESSERE